MPHYQIYTPKTKPSPRLRQQELHLGGSVVALVVEVDKLTRVALHTPHLYGSLRAYDHHLAPCLTLLYISKLCIVYGIALGQRTA